MNNNHILKWARKSGINVHVHKVDGVPNSIDSELLRILKKFAEYSAKYERQLCAKICHSQSQNESQDWASCAQVLEHRIKTRGRE